MVHDRSVGTDAQARGAGIDELDPLDLQAHRPLHEGRLTAQGYGAGRKENIITAAHQSLLGSDVGLNALLLLGWVLKMDFGVVDGPPLLRAGRRSAIGLGEQGLERFLGKRRRENSIHGGRYHQAPMAYLRW